MEQVDFRGATTPKNIQSGSHILHIIENNDKKAIIIMYILIKQIIVVWWSGRAP